jgi:hypothetical protein
MNNVAKILKRRQSMPTYNRWTDDPLVCHICGKHVENWHKQMPYDLRCDEDIENCFENRIKTRIIELKDLNLDPKYVPNFSDQMDLVLKSFRSAKIMQNADFVVIVHKNGGVEFIKDRYENTKGKVFFAE